MNATRTRPEPVDRRPVTRAHQRSRSFPVLLSALLVALLVISPGCRSPAGPKPGRTKLTSRLIVVPARVVGNLVVVETQWDRHGPWRFLVDTGSSTTLVSPEFSDRYATTEAALRLPMVRARGADGNTALLPAVTIRRIELGDARFERVQSLVYDCTELSAHLGLKIDGVLGFPLFRDTILTLDYPQSRLIMTTAGEAPLVPGIRLPFDSGAKIPLIPIDVGDRTLLALIDSGSDGPLNLNPIGLDLRFTSGPRVGATIGTLVGDRQQRVGRIEDTVRLGQYRLPEPVVDLTDYLSSLGGEFLRHFTITFDQVRGTATFHRDTTTPILSPPKRSSGISFSKTAAYWRVAGIVPDSPAAATDLRPGDLVVRINGENVEQWDLERFAALVETASAIDFTLLQGRTERPLRIPTLVLVP
jgi:hypothetical protein